MNFPSINIQGNILNSEIIDKIVSEELKYQDAPSFGLRKNDRLREEIGLAWSAIRGLWLTFRMRKNRISDNDSGTTETRNFWMLPFLTTLGYDVEKANAEIIDFKTYAISHRATNLQGFPVHIVGINDSLDKRRENAGPRLSPHALVQEYLNKSEDHLYAIATNGKQLRLLRDSRRLVKLTYLEFNLEKMMEEEIYTDFAILYRLLHATRMPREKGAGEQAFIEYYHQEALSSGTRIREKLSLSVEYAIKALANGFLQHPDNERLRNSAGDGITSPDAFYLQSLRLVYRILFLLVIEDRGLVYPDKLDENGRKKRDIYLRHYSIDRLRRLAAQQLYVEATKHDLWEGLKVSFRLFEDARFAHKLGLQALASGIFHPDALGSFEKTKLHNKHLLEVMEKLCYFSDASGSGKLKVNYGDLDVEEFGSVYEGLLEYKPVLTTVEHQLVFSFQKGSDRSSSGSHYTPEELVRPLIKHSLDYLIDDCLNKPHERLKNVASVPQKAMQEQALLDLKVCDVACGSGHILLSAARRIATELAKVRSGEDQPSPPVMRHALRDAIRHTIYGVDKNPLAVELCKVALWLEAHNPGEPLNFLDHHIKCGDSIVGLAHRDELEKGIADEAFKALPGDEKEVAAAFRKQNAAERKEREDKATQLKAEFEGSTAPLVHEAMMEYHSFAKMPEATPEQIEQKQRAYRQYLDGRGHQWLKQMADMQVAQFFIPKTTANKPYLLTDATYRQMLAGYNGWQGQQAAKAQLLAHEKRFFHWFIEFPEVFNEGGFDCVLGNPPFLGGQKLSGSFGYDYLEYLRAYFYPLGAEDLVVYFFRRIYTIISARSFLSLISTNTIYQGKAREGGLDVICAQNGKINHAFKGMLWPGVANLEVSLVTINKQHENTICILNNKIVDFISTFLDSNENDISPLVLKSNENKAFQGSIILGEGFIISESDAKKLIQKDSFNENVLFPYLNGDDLNNNINQSPSRWAINFFNWTEDKAKEYQEVYNIALAKVKPQRLSIISEKLSKGIRIGVHDNRSVEEWWKYLWPRPELYGTIKHVSKVLVQTRVSKILAFDFSPTNIIFSDATLVFNFQTFINFCILQSNFHECWARKYSSTLESRMRYSVTEAFQTFPFPSIHNIIQEHQLDAFGEAYHEHRRQLMLSMQLGLTKTYNAFHAPELQPGISTAMLQGLDSKAITKKYGKEVWNLWNHLQKTEGTCTLEEAIAGIQKLRELHVEMDNAVLEAYGWNNDESSITNYEYNSEAVIRNSKLTIESSVIRHSKLTIESSVIRNSKFVIDLKHDFYEVDYLPENDRIRFTIHPDARKEVLKRLLQLNHQYFEQEAREGKHKEETVRKFYEQKGSPIPDDVSKWFKKGKAYKKPKTSKSQVNEDEQGYGDLFDQ